MVRFGDAHIDVAARVVSRAGEPQHLEPQAFDLLAHLLEHRDRVVSKEELLDEVWGDQFVSESALTTRIKEIRRALGDDGRRQEVIKNHRGRGYRFVATLDDEAVPALVAAPTDLIGRDDEVATIVRELDHHAIVTLVGPGGAGKTTLARAAGEAIRGRFPGGLHFIDLTPVGRDEEVRHVVRRSTGLTETPDETLPAAVADLGALLVVDNCEHVLDGVAAFVDAVAMAAGPSRTIATSRERLGVVAEQVHPVGPLDHGAARDLLRARARASSPSYSWAAEEEGAVDRLLTMLDHLPLAIEMAAARLPSLGPRDLCEHLTRRMDLLRTPDRSTTARHRSLPELIAWSEELLDEDARSLLVDLSVFAGDATASDIAAVVGIDEATLVLGPLAALCDHSLLAEDRTAEPTRYRMFETVRATVAGRRAAGVDARHAHHVAEEVRAADRRLRSPDEAMAAARIDALVPEIRVAHRWSRSHDLPIAADLTAGLIHYAEERHWPEPASWCQEYRGRDDIPAAFAAAIAVDAVLHGDDDLTLDMGGRALASDDLRVVISAHEAISSVGMYGGDLERSADHGRQLMAIWDETSDVVAWYLAIVNLALSRLYAGDTEAARMVFDRHPTPPEASVTCRAWVAYMEAELLAAEGETDAAIERFGDAVEIGSTVGSRFVIGVARTSSLATQARSGDVDTALAEFVDVLEEHRRTRNLAHALTALRNLVVLLVRAERDELAMVVLGAVTGPVVGSAYGQESALLESSRATVEARHPAGTVADWVARGAAHDERWALDLAIESLP